MMDQYSPNSHISRYNTVHFPIQDIIRSKSWKKKPKFESAVVEDSKTTKETYTKETDTKEKKKQ